MTIGLLGDVMLGRGVAQALGTTAPEDLWSAEVKRLAAECDLVVCNLECCVSERGARTEAIRGKPFFFRAPPQAVGALRAIGARAASLANNHALDFGPEALVDTLRYLREVGVAAVGAGPGPDAARAGGVVQASSGFRLGVVAVSDHPPEFAAVEPDRPGVAYADLCAGAPSWLLEDIARLRARCDRVLCFPHWGPNMTTEPARWQRELAGELLAAGADLVAGHSAHVFHGVGRRDGALVLYDLGDALDDYRVEADLRNDLGLLALWSPDGDPELELVGLRLHYARTDLAYDADAEWIAGRLERACGALGTQVERVDEQRFRVG
ncbi:MAG TPA: CapA family protein [Thermoleophilaceae bacterium]|nr:CapA family protein [Thermoleophilaceae bacterium]